MTTLALQVDFVGAYGLLRCKPSVKMLTALTISFSFLVLFSSPVPDIFIDSFMWFWCFLPDIKRLNVFIMCFGFVFFVCVAFHLFVWVLLLLGFFVWVFFGGCCFFSLELQLFPFPAST